MGLSLSISIYIAGSSKKSNPLHIATVSCCSVVLLVTAVDEFASRSWVWSKSGASAFDAMLLDCVCNFHELVH